MIAAPAARAPGGMADRLALPAILIVAALLRLPSLATRGTWDGDQGHDMLVLRSLVQDGVIPLLGPPTSIGDVHHGAWYYYLLAPAAAVTGGDAPLAVVAVIALAGIAAVAVAWWLARTIGGPVAGAIAGLLLAVSAAAIEGSTFIWNPNVIALSSGVALAGAWRAWRGDDRRWWLVAAAGTAITMQGHVLGTALLPIVGVPFLLDARRRGAMGPVALGVAAIFLVAYLPLLVHEVSTGGAELRSALAYLGGGRESAETALPVRVGIVALRVVSWPLTGLITAGFIAGSLATLGVALLTAWRWGDRGAPPAERLAARWYGLGLVWSVAFLAVAAPSLAVVVAGLPNDHYHAFADPMVVVLVGIGLAAVTRVRPRPVGVVVAGAATLGLVAWNLVHLPPWAHPDGGFPAAAVAAERVDRALTTAGVARDDIIRLRSLPDFKSTEAVAYPLARLERRYVADVPTGVAPGSVVPDASGPRATERALVLLCDDLFRAAIGAPCGGPAESAAVPDAGWSTTGTLLDRFEAAPGRWISVYGPAGG